MGLLNPIIKNWQPLLLLVVLFVQMYSLINEPKYTNKTTTVYSTGQKGLSAYEVWLESGNVGTEHDFLNTLVPASPDKPREPRDGKDAVAHAVPAINGKDGLNAAPCTASQDTLTITCPDGSKLVIPQITTANIAFNANKDTCFLEVKNASDRLFAPLIKDPECFNYGS